MSGNQIFVLSLVGVAALAWVIVNVVDSWSNRERKDGQK